MEKDRPTNILLVNDDELDVTNVRRAFAKAHINDPLFHAEDGARALELLRKRVLPDQRWLVLLDLNMPRMGGIAFLRALRADSALRRTPVVMLTSSDIRGDLIEAYELNVAGYLVKPATFPELVDHVTILYQYWTMSAMP